MIAWLHSFRKWCWLTFAVGLAAAVWGLLADDGNRLLVGAGLAAMLGVVAIIECRRWRQRRNRSAACDASSQESLDRSSDDARSPNVHDDSPTDADEADETGERQPAQTASAECPIKELVDTLLREGRYALLLRPQIAASLDADLLATCCERLQQQMTLVPAGDVQIEPHLVAEEPLSAAELAAAQAVVAPVDAAYLDRYPVTNRQYQVFVNAGGYDQMGLWEPAIWPAVLDFTDATGHPGPRYWQHGRFPRGKADHPVVGVSWYEAAAYARWVGKRLPNDAEWLKAGSWPVQLSPTSRVQRKFPWGNAMDRSRANLWGSGPGDTTTVDDFGPGASVGGLCQLIGNVWEWTDADFKVPSLHRNRRIADLHATNGGSPSASTASCTFGQPAPAEIVAAAHGSPLKTLRGGAFDTYFDHQSACQFASGDSPLARKYNIGFRLALGAGDLAGESESETNAPAESARARSADEEVLQPV